jgi:4-amino-4-deoxy-L-arabinose transferase-like glycosyltransferase
MARSRDRGTSAVATADHTTTEIAPDRFGRWLAAIAVVALALRTAYVLYAHAHPLPGFAAQLFGGVGGDGVDYHGQALRNLQGHWFTASNGHAAVAQHPPAWILLLTLASALGAKSILSQQLFSAVVGTATVVAVGFAGRRIAGPRAGLIAAAIAAVYAEMWIYERALLSETPLMLLLALLVLIVYRFLDRATLWRAVGIGAMCGLIALTRSEQILLLPLLVAPLVLGRRQLPLGRRVVWLGLSGLAALLVISPWTIYNQSRFVHPVVLSLGLGSATVIANCDGSYYGPHTGWYTLSCPRTFVAGDQSVQEASDRHIALDYAEHHLGRLPVVMVARQGRAFGFWAPFQETDLDSHWQLTHLWVNRLALWSYWLLLIPAVGGVVVLRRRRVPVYPLLVPIVVIALAVALTFGETRYRASGEVSLVLLAAIGLDAVLRPARRAATEDRSSKTDDASAAVRY